MTAAVTMYAIDQGRWELDSDRSEDLDPGVRLNKGREQGHAGPSGRDSCGLPRPSLPTRSGHFSWPPPLNRQVAASPFYSSALVSLTLLPAVSPADISTCWRSSSALLGESVYLLGFSP